MKRIRSAVLAAILAFSGASQAQNGPTTRCRNHPDSTGASSIDPKMPRAGYRDEQQGALSRDYTQESALNRRQRDAMRQKARTGKEKARDPVTD
ncbi:hypothetical protein KTD31_03325 [Burkholderia multivorans]|jgi:hypothetical protein|uniref:hypothetical protein n=1 Tax=Burkholderia multivorans TaxID=87883 RepID=UPI001C23560D|nr:hypothetical protein [Burkholderia multivorans]MBU9200384.1 hypothetical protein [Burkholderia multivorans]MDN8078491.1 hypothetical protein [Burkholderia multivorans]